MATDFNDPMSQADAAHVAGNLPEAERLARLALNTNPELTRAQLLLGVVSAKMGNTEEASAYLEKVRWKEPQSFIALYWLSRIARRNGDAEKSLLLAEKAQKVQPEDPVALQNLGQSQIAVGKYSEAVENLKKAAEASPTDAQVFYYLGLGRQNLRQDAEAIAAYRRAVELDPSFFPARISLGQLLLAESEFEEAQEQAEAVLRQNPSSAQANYLLVDILLESKQAAKAEEHLKKLGSQFPKDSRIFAKWGQCLAVLGRAEEADEKLHRSIELQPVQGFAYFNLATNGKVGEDLLRRMEELVANPSINAIGRRHLYYGLGKAYEALGEYEKAMNAFDEANRIDFELKFGDQPFDRRKYTGEIDWILRTFTKEFLEKHASVGSPDDLPIFIVGMIRSGTTLVEQILSSHPRVEAAGEQNFWPRHWEEAFPRKVFNEEKGKALAERYLSVLRRYGPAALHVTDKMPANYAHLGIIHLLLPKAKIIHTRRNSLDTCLSIYTTPNPSKNPTGNDKANIVYGYRQYERLMEHWRTVLPAGSMLEIDYENLISSTEAKTRELVAFCGLEWDDACLRPEENTRGVATPSAWQVRRPVYSTSVGRWRNYEPWLGEFAELTLPG